MAISKAQICNIALSTIHYTDTTIGNLDTDTGVEANQCRIHYDIARQFVLSDHHWNFATRRVALALFNDVSVVAPADYNYRYVYPDDCLTFQYIELNSKRELPIPYKTEGVPNGLSILTDRENAIGVYTADVENVSLFSPVFVKAFASYLASVIAAPLTGDFKVQEASLKVYRDVIGTAMKIDSQESEANPEYEAPWERARFGEE